MTSDHHATLALCLAKWQPERPAIPAGFASRVSACLRPRCRYDDCDRFAGRDHALCPACQRRCRNLDCPVGGLKWRDCDGYFHDYCRVCECECQMPGFTDKACWKTRSVAHCGCFLCDECRRGCLCDDASTGAYDDHRYKTADAPATP